MIRALALSLMLLCGSAHAGGAACFPQSPWVPINLSGKGLMEGADARMGGTWSAILTRSMAPSFTPHQKLPVCHLPASVSSTTLL